VHGHGSWVVEALNIVYKCKILSLLQFFAFYRFGGQALHKKDNKPRNEFFLFSNALRLKYPSKDKNQSKCQHPHLMMPYSLSSNTQLPLQSQEPNRMVL
ncbi:unnamed protein product, partial [Dovyalis caffra]